jgi:hypothetical protein
MRGSILGSSKIFFSSKPRDKLWGQPRLVVVERASAEVKNEWSCISTVCLRPHVVERDKFTLCFLIISYWEMSARYMTVLLHVCHSRYFLCPFAILGLT